MFWTRLRAENTAIHDENCFPTLKHTNECYTMGPAQLTNQFCADRVLQESDLS